MNIDAPLTKRQANRLAKYERLVSTAMRMVGEMGLDAFSLHKLAGELGLTVGALYRYFPSKGALVAALENQVIAETGEALRAAVEEIDGVTGHLSEAERALTRLVAIAYTYRQRQYDAPQQMRLISGLMSNPEPLLDSEDALQVVAHMMDTLAVVREAVDAARAHGVFDEGGAHERALILWAALRGVAETKKLDRDEFGVFQEARLFELTLEALLRGWGATQSGVRQAQEIVFGTLEIS